MIDAYLACSTRRKYLTMLRRRAHGGRIDPKRDIVSINDCVVVFLGVFDLPDTQVAVYLLPDGDVGGWTIRDHQTGFTYPNLPDELVNEGIFSKIESA